jgi:hypothetical protein
MKKITATVEQIQAALETWYKTEAEDPDHFKEWTAAIEKNRAKLGEFFASLLVEHGAVVAS